LKIKAIQVGSISLPLVRPFKTALRTVEAVNDIVVRVIADDGSVGYGEAPPTAVITGDTTGSILCAVRDFIRPAIVGMELDDLDAVMAKLDGCMVHNTTPKAAVDMALYDLWAKAQGKPLYQLLGGARTAFKTDITISVNPVDQMVADSLDAVQQGFDILKIKVGKEGLADVERMAAIRAAVGPDVKLRVDANQGWTAEQSVAIIRAMEDKGLGIELVEQPVPAHDLAGLRAVTAAVDTPILADEAVFSCYDAANIIEQKAADLINIKLMKTGGIHNALKICRMAEENGVECMIGCMLESRLSVAAAAHLAAGQSVVTRADLDGPSLCSVDPYTGGPVFDGPSITMTDDPGVGVDNVPCDNWSD
jgi:L-Ala-D/L-Glu epimerase